MRLWPVLLAGLLPAVVHADALEWLQRMNEAVRQTTYHGVAVYRSGDQLETLRVYHRYAEGQERERMVALSGQPREILRKDDEVTCILPEQEAVLVDHPGLRTLLPKLSRTAFERLRSHYELTEIKQQARIAGRICHGIRITAQDQYRYNYEVWLDQETALPLDIRLLGEDGELLEQVVFTQLELPDRLDDSVFLPDVDTSGFQRILPDAVAQGTNEPQVGAWEFHALPAGFRLATREQQRLPGMNGPVTHLHFTDGLAAVSVFATPQMLPEQALNGLTRLGAVNAYGRMLEDYHVTVVGEVPQATVRFFADNLRRVPPLATPAP